MDERPVRVVSRAPLLAIYTHVSESYIWNYSSLACSDIVKRRENIAC